jgi:hypothetical protein
LAAAQEYEKSLGLRERISMKYLLSCGRAVQACVYGRGPLRLSLTVLMSSYLVGADNPARCDFVESNIPVEVDKIHL